MDAVKELPESMCPSVRSIFVVVTQSDDAESCVTHIYGAYERAEDALAVAKTDPKFQVFSCGLFSPQTAAPV